jgi:SAM-dependent methyltransferase
MNDIEKTLLTDAHYASYPEDLPFWLSLAQKYPGPALELGCGTGRVLLTLAETGTQTWGIDIDLTAVEILQQRLSSRSLPGQVVAADMTKYQLHQQFSLIISPCNTYSTLDTIQRRQVLERTRLHLISGGCFAASIPNPEILIDTEDQDVADEPEETIIHPETKFPVQVSSSYYCRANCFYLTWHYDHLLPDGSVKRLDLNVQHFIQPASEYLAEIQAAGFKVLNIWGDYDHTPYTPESPYLIWEATPDF